ncbi:MAG TPA: cytochrome c3 family protein [Vicinamibacterales bacterium]|nr:cytochrome c3 family protein [Vicinamibacterales bacterium]
MFRSDVLFVTLAAALACGTGSAAAQSQSRCADCHFANPGSVSASHLSDWDMSGHGRNGVGCETCHGGDATSFEPFIAHRGILAPANPASPVHRANLSKTCGTCHAGPFVQFQRSKHFELLRAGDKNGPTCTTCHGESAGTRLSPKALESQCASCHGADKVAPHSEFPARGRLALAGLRDARAMLKDARRAIARVKDPERRASLEAAAQQAEVPIIEATQAGHAFVFDQLDERLTTAQARLNALFDRLSNPDVR